MYKGDGSESQSESCLKNLKAFNCLMHASYNGRLVPYP
jgi:hypothetical protein